MAITRDTISINNDHSYDYYVNFGKYKPSATFDIYDTHELNARIDKIRKAKGLVPFFDDSGEYNCDAWYEFEATISADSKTGVLDHLNVEVVLPEKFGDYYYDIPISEEEQVEIYNALNDECIKLFGKDCNAILEEAENQKDENGEYIECAMLDGGVLW